MNLSPRPWLPALVLYLFSYGFWFTVLGPGFKSYKLLDFTHIINPEWLRQDLAMSLINLHSQPPLLNLLVGTAFKVAPDHYEAIFRTLYFLAGAGAVIAIDATLRLLRFSTFVRLIAVALLCLTPTFYMYGTWYYTTHLELCLCAAMLYGFARYGLIPEKRIQSLLGIFICFALLGLLRAQWHLILFIALTAALMAIGGRRIVRPALLLSLIFVVPIGGWYVKNQMLFGFFGGSSWVGANLSQVARAVGYEDVQTLKLTGRIAGDFPGEFDMAKITRRVPPQLVPEEKPHPALTSFKSADPVFAAYVLQPGVPSYVPLNLNYIGIVTSAQQDLRDSLTIIRKHPWDYLSRVVQRYYLTSFTPSFYYDSLNLIDLRTPLESRISPLVVFYTLDLAAFVLYALVPLFAIIETLRRPSPRRPFLLLCFALMIFLCATACGLNGYEQERMRWGWQPVYIVFAAIMLERILNFCFNRRKNLHTTC